ncbi:hypothetical protein SAMN06265348_106187 [Pedobacter westerhofensis]|uniref:Uncharacterized protein n=1 Tax=Pedobacter westerhofensis TaxID=425512 RepID=A0A521DU82_9SPHI|nr:hypothetical protein SAMN06265348_106187 [Pedobacter westerhofensis]
MVLFVIILSTMINTSYDLNQTQTIMSRFKSIKQWNCDLEDEDKVLRIISTREISSTLIAEFRKAGVSTQIMEVFKKTEDSKIKVSKNSE